MRFVILTIIGLLLAGCDNRKCAKSHEVSYWQYTPQFIGKTTIIVPMYVSYSVCDEYVENTASEVK